MGRRGEKVGVVAAATHVSVAATNTAVLTTWVTVRSTHFIITTTHTTITTTHAAILTAHAILATCVEVSWGARIVGSWARRHKAATELVRRAIKRSLHRLVGSANAEGEVAVRITGSGRHVIVRVRLIEVDGSSKAGSLLSDHA